MTQNIYSQHPVSRLPLILNKPLSRTKLLVPFLSISPKKLPISRTFAIWSQNPWSLASSRYRMLTVKSNLANINNATEAEIP